MDPRFRPCHLIKAKKHREIMATETATTIPSIAPKASVLVPLYIYPVSDKTWQPLYEAIAAHPTVDFLVIVNPNSGPGVSFLPGRDYVREVPKLNDYANVTTVGYVLIDYCRRPLSDVYADIKTYAGWATNNENTGLGVKGIFLDETPNHHSTERAEYLYAVHQHIKAMWGILGDRLVIHNPGTPPDPGLVAPVPDGPDIVVTCEESYDRYRGNEVQKRLKEYHYDRARSGCIISAVPRDEMGSFVQELRHRGAYLFATDLVHDFYEDFGSGWHDFVTAMETP
ncbi:cell surface spherulin 4-like protein [Bisporella sp. PMI_857]|nr:cell surface spherulin 4-like protein [Bisporella sp. PMI_857]